MHLRLGLDGASGTPEEEPRTDRTNRDGRKNNYADFKFASHIYY